MQTNQTGAFGEQVAARRCFIHSRAGVVSLLARCSRRPRLRVPGLQDADGLHACLADCKALPVCPCQTPRLNPCYERLCDPAPAWHEFCKVRFPMTKTSGQKTKKQPVSPIQLKGGWNATQSKLKQKYAQFADYYRNFTKGREEELMGRPGTALLVSMRLARLRETGKGHGRP